MESEKHSTTEASPGRSSPVEMTRKEAETDAVGAFIADEYPHGTRLAAIVVSLLLGMFLVALDNVRQIHPFLTHHRANKVYRQTILGTAIPRITDEFQDLNKVSWYGSAYFMTFGGG